MTLHLATPDDTDALGRALAATLPAGGMVVHLVGDLGAGKSTLARALLRGLGVTGPVRSPTYTLVERYTTTRGDALHLDLYRIGDAAELEFLGLEADDASLWLIEWPERGRGGAVPAVDLEIRLDRDGGGRIVAMTAHSPAADRWLTSSVALFTAGNPELLQRK